MIGDAKAGSLRGLEMSKITEVLVEVAEILEMFEKHHLSRLRKRGHYFSLLMPMHQVV